MSRDRTQVVIKGLRLPCVVGVHAWEREVTQELRLDLWLDWEFAAAARSDDLADALDYSSLSARLQAHAAASQPQLLERLVVELADLLELEFRVRGLELRLHKPGAVPAADDVSVRLVRTSAGQS